MTLLTLIGTFLWFTPPSQAQDLPEIEARRFNSTVVRKSRTGRVYLFKTAEGQLPKTGSLVLIRDQNRPIMAFRVLKTISEGSQYIAKRIRRYDQVGELPAETSYSSLEKVADILPAPEASPNVAQPLAPIPLNTVTNAPADPALDSNVQAAENLEIYDFDRELDETTSPQKTTSIEDEFLDQEAFTDLSTAYEVVEEVEVDRFNNMISVSAGYFRNMSDFALSAGGTSNGFTLSYGRTLGKRIFARGKTTQDSIGIELGAIYYRIIDLDSSRNEIYTLLPVYGHLRYHFFLSQSFALVLYGGLQYNSVISEENGSVTKLDEIQGIQGNIGSGFLYNMGPQWYLRADLGLDRIALGLAVRW